MIDGDMLAMISRSHEFQQLKVLLQFLPLDIRPS